MRGRIKGGWESWHLFPELGVGKDYSNALTSRPKDYMVMEIYG